MVFGVCGKLGGGKSLFCVRVMLDALRRGDFVTSNIKLKEDYLKKHHINASNYTFLPDFTTLDPWTLRAGDFRGSRGKKRSLIVVDEAGEWLDSYSDARHSGQLKDIASWLRQSDKLGQDVYFIVQFENLLHNRLRSVVHYWVVCQDFAKWNLPLIPLKIPILSRFCVASFFDGRKRECIQRIFTLKSPLIYDAYDTSAFFGNSAVRFDSSNTLELTGENYYTDSISERAFFNLLIGVLLLFTTLAILSGSFLVSSLGNKCDLWSARPEFLQKSVEGAADCGPRDAGARSDWGIFSKIQ